MDQQRVNLDGFAVEDAELGLTALHSPHDPAPSLVIRDGRVVELDGVPEAEFDSIDAYIARHGLDLGVAAEAMAVPDVDFAQRLVDPAVPRAEIVRLSAGATPAKLARVLALLRPPELVMAMTKLRARRTPSNQAHVTNRLDDPLLLAADAATAAAFGFREIETTVPVLADAPSNAVACLIGAAFGADGVLIQCSVEEALELELGMRGLTSYAETVSLYGTEQVFTDGDDTPWSKAFLTSAYASRGMKMRVSSGAGAEVLMAGARGQSMLYLEARCVALARAIGAQGVQNGGIDGASVAAAVPSGLRELMAENVMVMMRNLESCSGNDALMSESDMRRTSRTLPIVLAGSDFAFSGFGSIQRYDNMFGPSNFNAEDIDDFLAMQRDWGIDGGLRTVAPARIGELRREAAQACRAVYAHLGLADFTDSHVDLATDAAGSKDLGETDTLAVLSAAHAIRQRGLTVVDIVAALDECGYFEAAERAVAFVRARLSGDYLQTSAIFDEQLGVLSLVTDPNDYAGPGTGYAPSPARQREIDAIRQARGVDDLRAVQARAAVPLLAPAGPARPGLGPARRGHRRLARGRPGRVAVPVRAGRDRRAARDAGRPGGGGLHRAGGPVQRLGGPGPDRPGRGPAGRLGHRHRPAGQGHGADPPPGPGPAGQPGAVLCRALRHPGAVPPARRQRRPPRQGRHPRPGPQSVLRRGHRGPLPHHGDRPDGTGAPPDAPPRPGRAVTGGTAVTTIRRCGRCPGEPVDDLTLDAVRPARSAWPTCGSTRRPWSARRWWPSSTGTRSWRTTCAGPRS